MLIETQMTAHQFFLYLMNLKKLSELELFDKSLNLNESNFSNIVESWNLWLRCKKNKVIFKTKFNKPLSFRHELSYEMEEIYEGIIRIPIGKDTAEISRYFEMAEYLDYFDIDNFLNDEDIGLHPEKVYDVQVYIYNYVKELSTGCTFGDIGLQSSNKKRTASVFMTEDTYLGIIDHKGFEDFIKEIKEGAEKSIRNSVCQLLSCAVFVDINKVIFQKYFFSLFQLGTSICL